MPVEMALLASDLSLAFPDNLIYEGHLIYTKSSVAS